MQLALKTTLIGWKLKQTLLGEFRISKIFVQLLDILGAKFHLKSGHADSWLDVGLGNWSQTHEFAQSKYKKNCNKLTTCNHCHLKIIVDWKSSIAKVIWNIYIHSWSCSWSRRSPWRRWITAKWNFDRSNKDSWILQTLPLKWPRSSKCWTSLMTSAWMPTKRWWFWATSKSVWGPSLLCQRTKPV